MNKSSSACLVLIVYFLIVSVVSAFVGGWALSTIWNWFIPPLFGLVSLNLWQAIGVSYVLQLFTGTNNVQKSKSDAEDMTTLMVQGLVNATLVPVISVAVSWIVLQFAF